MKFMLNRHWVDMCQVAMIAMATFSRCGALAAGFPAVGIMRNQRKVCHHSSIAAKPFYVIGLQLLAGLGLPAASAMAQEPAGMVKFDSAASWNLTETTVVNKGQVDMLTEGEFAHDFIIESKATATNPAGSVVPLGTFKLIMSAFSPAYDQRGQRKGIWYVWGKWTLTDARALQSGNTKQRAGEMSGQLSAELTFNPIVSQQNWTAKVRVPMTRVVPVAKTESNQAVGSQTARGEGALTMDSKHEGSISLNLRLWPPMQH